MMNYRYSFVMDVKPSELSSTFDSFTKAKLSWRLHSIWQRIPDTRQPSRINESLVLYDMIFEQAEEI